MKAFSKITILAAAAAFLCSCEMEYYKEELYRKEIFIVSGENNILGQEFEYGEKGFQGELAIYASGTTGLDQNVTVKLGLDFEAASTTNAISTRSSRNTRWNFPPNTIRSTP